MTLSVLAALAVFALVTTVTPGPNNLMLLCSGSIKPDTNVGGNIATRSEVSDDQETTYFFS